MTGKQILILFFFLREKKNRYAQNILPAIQKVEEESCHKKAHGPC